jgi:peroxiredoxin Q/BCP
MGLPKIGNLAPLFSLKNQNDELVSLKDFRGKQNVVLYFYPKASTPGCTVQACGIRDTREEFAKLDTVVLGVSPDAPTKLKKFMDKYDLNFDLLADEDHAIAEAYGVWDLKKFMGKAGRLQYVTEKVNTKTHDQDMLAILRNGI